MKYFVEKSVFNMGNSQFMEISPSYANSPNAHSINLIEGVYTFHLYLLPWESCDLLCLWFNYDSVLNLHHWDDILGIPKQISPNEFWKYKSIMKKPYPNYIHAYDRGRDKDFSAPALFRILDPEQNQNMWCLCLKSNWQGGDDDVLLQECNTLIRYVIAMINQLNNNNIDWKDRALLNIKEGVKMGIKSYISPLSLLKEAYTDVDWIEIAKNDPNW